MDSRFKETSNSVRQLAEEKDILHQAYNEEIKRIQLSARDHFQKIFNDHANLKLQLELEKSELDLYVQELEKREAHNESERKRLSKEVEKVLDSCVLAWVLCLLLTNRPRINQRNHCSLWNLPKQGLKSFCCRYPCSCCHASRGAVFKKPVKNIEKLLSWVRNMWRWMQTMLESKELENALRNSSLQHAAMVQHKANENVLKLVEERERGSTQKNCATAKPVGGKTST